VLPTLKNELLKGDLERATAELLKVVPFTIGRKLVLLLLSSYRPYSISFHSLKQTFLYTFLRRSS